MGMILQVKCNLINPESFLAFAFFPWFFHIVSNILMPAIKHVQVQIAVMKKFHIISYHIFQYIYHRRMIQQKPDPIHPAHGIGLGFPTHVINVFILPVKIFQRYFPQLQDIIH